MAFGIDNWNLAENRTLYVRLYDTSAAVGVELYLTAAAAAAQTGRQAAGAAAGYGSALAVTLSADAGAAIEVETHQDDYAWHLQVSGVAGDADTIFKVREFVDLDDVVHPIYRDSDLITARARADIDAHTHVRIAREAPLAVHLPEVDAGDVVRVTSARRGISQDHQVLAHVIDGTPGSLTSSLELLRWEDLTR